MTVIITLLTRLPRAVRRLWENGQFRGLVVVTAATVMLGTIFYWRVEGWSVLDSLYFCVITLATVGHGELAPATRAGKAFTTLYVLAGVGILSGFIYVVAKNAINQRRGRDD